MRPRYVVKLNNVRLLTFFIRFDKFQINNKSKKTIPSFNALKVHFYYHIELNCLNFQDSLIIVYIIVHCTHCTARNSKSPDLYRATCPSLYPIIVKEKKNR